MIRTASLSPSEWLESTNMTLSSSAVGTMVKWFRDEPASGSWNMALDEALLLDAAAGGPATLRFYEWREPTLSLGYFQRAQDRKVHSASTQCPLVRRATGGGAIVHDNELTYSFILPMANPLARSAADLYHAVHSAIVAVLSEYGLVARLYDCSSGDSRLTPPLQSAVGCGADGFNEATDCLQSPADTGAQPFLCFQRRATGDVLLDGRKVAGSAQRRQRGAVLQHGSILFGRSNSAPELPGIAELSSVRPSVDEFAAQLRQVLSAQLHIKFILDHPAADVRDRAASIDHDKFQAQSWNQMR